MEHKTRTSTDSPKPATDEKQVPDLAPRDANEARDEQVKGGVIFAGGGVPGIRQQ